MADIKTRNVIKGTIRTIEADVPPLALKTWLGHRDIHITLDTYADVFENMHNSAIEKVEKYADMIDRSQKHEKEQIHKSELR